MKYLHVFIFIITFSTASAQIKYYDAKNFPLYGKVSNETETVFERLPAALKTIVRPDVWELGKNTAGLYLRFKTNSTSISLKWEVTLNRTMDHMPATGIKSFDLYRLVNGKWDFVNVARTNTNSLSTESKIISNMDHSEKELLLFFPLYDGVKSLMIGVDEGSSLSMPKVDLPNHKLPAICYGTSILQGGCASRPGMVFTNILTRWYNKEFINLGFSANASLDYEIAELIASKESSLIILDFMANVNSKIIEDKLEKFHSIIREKAPYTPILLVEMTYFPQMGSDLKFRKVVEDSNNSLAMVYKKLKKKGDKNLHFVPAENMIGNDNEGTVDGVHFTDLGYMRYAEHLKKFINKHIKGDYKSL
ncbi:SGNH/GDSL hydrolase family protein [Sphingobacterium sp. HJSM2_6]|uniref:SGNH/GDSL hydrolase family protein n=1 Tax=Sphingobacterium sp. HJSM2_6 TaxID=3366264 RepID=UPI003BD0AAC3